MIKNYKFQKFVEEDVQVYNQPIDLNINPPFSNDPLSENKRQKWIQLMGAPFQDKRHSEYVCFKNKDIKKNILISAVLVLPFNLDQFFKKMRSDSRSNLKGNAAKNKGYFVKHILPNDYAADIYEIIHSCDKRQNRKISKHILDRPSNYKFEKYKDFKDKNFQDICLGVFDQLKILRGYILGFRVGDHVFYDEIMGHALFLKDNIMHFLHYYFVRSCLQLEIVPKYLNYGPWYSGNNPFDISSGLNLWKRKLGFRPAYLISEL